MTTSYREPFSTHGFTLIETIISIVIIAFVVAMMTSYFGVGITRSSTPVAGLQASANLKQIMEMFTAQYTQSPHWRAGTPYATSSSVTPTMQNQNGCLYVATHSGTSGSSEPLWPVFSTAGSSGNGSVNDGTVTWAWSGTVLPQWLASSHYAVGSIVIPKHPNGVCYVATKTGTSGGSEPAWPTSSGTVNDSGVAWSYNGPATPLMQLQASIGTEGSDQTASFGSGPGKVTYSYHVYQNRFIKFDANNNEVNINAATGDPSYGRYLKIQIGLSSTAASYTLQTLAALFAM